LAVAEKTLDQQFAHKQGAAFDMEQIINATKQSGKVYDNLATYMFNDLIKAHNDQGKFDLVSPFTWITILMWVASMFALVLVVLLRFKVRSLTMLLMARTAQAESLGVAVDVPKILAFSTTTSAPRETIDIWRNGFLTFNMY